ncbi:N-acetyltransferase [Shewanella sp. AS1]|uniref:GNAT family N-acetyltransferase n=1 Tax=Shewanella sp. AS1 TaxID=2907626 RepID=UPI001F2C8411|nr:N-acetyltransferase [Shewanella sp. AS1]MCE9679466.1 N-acetyltransferase [Shewanella sp. AS1]
MNIKIRHETSSDIQSIEAVTIAAFRDAPHTGHNEHLIVQGLRDAGVLTLSLIAEQNGQTIGHLAISPVALSDGKSGYFGLGPVSVLPDYQSSGIGSKLINHALEELKRMGALACVVLGEPAYYARFGVKADADLVLKGVPAEYFQVIKFTPHKTKSDVVYHSAFYIEG